MPLEPYPLPITNVADVAPLISSIPEPSKLPSPDFSVPSESASISPFNALKLARMGTASRLALACGIVESKDMERSLNERVAARIIADRCIGNG